MLTAPVPTGWGTGPEGACGAAFRSLCILPDWTVSVLFALAMGLEGLSALADGLEGLSALAGALEDEDEVRDLSLSLCLFFPILSVRDQSSERKFVREGPKKENFYTYPLSTK